MTIESQARSLLHLFDPGRHAFGTLSAVGIPGPDGKLDKKQLTKKAPLTDELVVKHLRDASKTLGFIPHVDDVSCRFGAIDVDQYKKEIGSELARKFAGTPLFVARSPSGGSHVYRISDERVTCEEMRAYLHDVIDEHLPAQDGIDCIFPKQPTIDIAGGGVGNYINAPLAGILGARPVNGETDHRFDRCIYDDNGEPINDLDLALDFIESKIAPLPNVKRETPTVNRVEPTLGVRDLREIGDGNRGDTIISFGSSMIARGLDFESQVVPMVEALFEQTRKATDQNPRAELDGILKNLRRKADKQPPVGFSRLVKLVPETRTKKDRVRWRFNYNATPVVIESSALLRRADHIADRLLEECDEIVNFTRGAWLAELEALKEKSIDPTTGKLPQEIDEDSRSASILWSLNNAIMRSFNRCHIHKPTEKKRLLSGTGAQAWLDPKSRRVYFVPDPMVATVNQDKTISVNTDRAEILEIVRAKGGDRAKKTLAPGVSMRVYWIPCPDDLFDVIADPDFDGLDHEVIETQKRIREPKIEISDKTALEIMGEPKEPEMPF